MAKSVGGEWGCGICYRPCKGKPMKVSWWGSRGVHGNRRVCYSCFIIVKAFITAEASKQRWDSQLPVLDMGEE